MASADDAGRKHYRPVRSNPGIYAYNLKSGQLRYAAVATFKGRQSWSSGHRTVDDAKAGKAAALRKLGGGDGGNQLLRDYLEVQWLDSVEVNDGSLRAYKVAVAKVVEWLKAANQEKLRLNELQERDVQAFKNWMRKQSLADNTANRYFAKLAQATRHAWMIRLINEDPCQRVKRPAKGKYTPPRVGIAELAALMEAAFESPYGLIVYMAVASGLREEKELFSALWSDLDMRSGEMTIVGKGDKQRTVVLDEMDLKVLFAHRQLQMKRFGELNELPPKNIFVNADGKAWTQSNFYEAWNKIRQAAADKIEEQGGSRDIARMHFHDLRHVHITSGAKAGVAVAVMQQRVGHEDGSLTLNIYTHTDVEDQRPAAKAISEFIRSAYNPFENALSDSREVDS